MSRAVRTARGAFGALAATLLAAASHGLAGGTITPLAIIATTLLALPLCVLLAGRVASIWRLALAVVSAQFVYHWSFAGLGMAQGRGSSSTTSAAALAPHDHLGALAAFAPSLNGADAGGSGMLLPASAMWISHALAAAFTIALLHRGEAAAMRLLRVLRRAVAVPIPSGVRLPVRPAILFDRTHARPNVTQVFLSAISHRGPPALSFSR